MIIFNSFMRMFLHIHDLNDCVYLSLNWALESEILEPLWSTILFVYINRVLYERHEMIAYMYIFCRRG